MLEIGEMVFRRTMDMDVDVDICFLFLLWHIIVKFPCSYIEKTKNIYRYSG